MNVSWGEVGRIRFDQLVQLVHMTDAPIFDDFFRKSIATSHCNGAGRNDRVDQDVEGRKVLEHEFVHHFKVKCEERDSEQ